MLRAGIVGLPNVGKSTLFNALTRTRKAEAANYPFCTIEPNVGVVTVPDPRLEPLAKISRSERIVPATIEFVDIAGLVKGASQGEGLGNKFLQHIREVDAIVERSRGQALRADPSRNRGGRGLRGDRVGARGAPGGGGPRLSRSPRRRRFGHLGLDPRRLSPARSAHLSDRGRQGGPRLDDP